MNSDICLKTSEYVSNWLVSIQSSQKLRGIANKSWGVGRLKRKITGETKRFLSWKKNHILLQHCRERQSIFAKCVSASELPYNNILR